MIVVAPQSTGLFADQTGVVVSVTCMFELHIRPSHFLWHELADRSMNTLACASQRFRLASELETVP